MGSAVGADVPCGRFKEVGAERVGLESSNQSSLYGGKSVD